MGNLYITGWDASDNFPLVDPGNGAYMQHKLIPNQVPFIMQFNASTKLVWSTHMEGDDYDPLERVEVDKKGNIYLAANMRSRVYPWLDAGGYFNTSYGFSIARFNINRQLTWCTSLPGPVSLDDITTDEECNLYVASGKGILRKFNEKTELVWTQQYPQARAYGYNRMVYDKKNKAIHILGHMDDYTNDDFPTKNTACGSAFFYSGKGGQFYNTSGPIFTTYTTDGNLQYCSLADWPNDNYSNSNFSVDSEGNLVYFFFILTSGTVGSKVPTLINPGNGTYFHTEINYGGETPYIIKLKPSELNITTTITASTTCDCNNVVDVTPVCGKAPFTYQWSNGDTSANVKLCSGDYWIKVTDSNFLTKIMYVTIPKSPSGVQSFNADVQDTHCDQKNGSLFVKDIQGGTGPYVFSLNNQTFSGSNTYTAIDSGNYIVTVKDANGCMAKDTFSVKNIAGPTEMHSIVAPASCNKDDAVINIDKMTGGAEPYFYSINNQPYSTGSIFKNLPASSTGITVKDAAGCVFSSTIVVPQSLPPDSAHLIIQPDHCFSGIGSLSVTSIYGGSQPFSISIDSFSYASQLSINRLKSGAYDLYIKDGNGCLLKNEFVVGNVPAPEKISYKIQDAVCGNTAGAVLIDSVINGHAPYVFSLNGQTYQSSSSFGNVPYRLKIALGASLPIQ